MVVQIVLLSESTLSLNEDLQNAVETSRSLSMWQSWDKRLTKPLYTLSTMNNIFHDSNSNSNRIICKGYISYHGRWKWCWICLHSSSNIVGDTHAHYTWPPKSYGCILHMMYCRSQMLGVVASVCTPLPTRTWQIPTLLAQRPTMLAVVASFCT